MFTVYRCRVSTKLSFMFQLSQAEKIDLARQLHIAEAAVGLQTVQLEFVRSIQYVVLYAFIMFSL